MRRYFVAFLMIVLVTILAIFLLTRGSKSPVTSKQQSKTLHDYANSDATVVLTTQGRVVGDDKYRSIRITVGRDFRRVEVLDGYNQVVEKTTSFSNNQTAYDVFLRALELNGFNKIRKVVNSDERGVCSSGNRFIYELKDGSNNVQRTWSTSCTTAQGTYAGQPTVKQLFQAQITGYGVFISGVSL